MIPKGRYRKLSDRQVDIVRLINHKLGVHTLSALIKVDYRIIRYIRQNSHAYACKWPMVDDDLVVEAQLLEYFEDIVRQYDNKLFQRGIK